MKERWIDKFLSDDIVQRIEKSIWGRRNIITLPLHIEGLYRMNDRFALISGAKESGRKEGIPRLIC